MNQPDDARPLLVVVANTATPYRVHFLKRIADEMPDYRLVTFFTHEIGDAPWAINLPERINPIQFGSGESVDGQAQLKNACREWNKGGRMIDWLRGKDVAGVLVITYNDLGRLRLIRWLDRKKIPVFLSGDSNIRGDRAAGLKRILKRLWLGYLLKKCTAILPCGRLGSEFFIRYRADPSKIHLMPVEPDYAEIDSVDQPQIDAARTQFNLPVDRRRFIFSGRLVPEKRVDLLIDAFIHIADEKPDWDLLIAGDGPLRTKLENRVPAALRDRIIFLGFIDNQRLLTAIYKACNILVLPSDYEPWGLVINEAAACGLAIVASDVVGAAHELVHPGVNGMIFPNGDVQKLQDAMLAVTHGLTSSQLQTASPGVLRDWRTHADPITTLRHVIALRIKHNANS